MLYYLRTDAEVGLRHNRGNSDPVKNLCSLFYYDMQTTFLKNLMSFLFNNLVYFLMCCLENI